MVCIKVPHIDDAETNVHSNLMQESFGVSFVVYQFSYFEDIITGVNLLIKL